MKSPGIQTLFPTLLMATLAALTFWLSQRIQPEPAAPDGRQRHDPDFIVERFTLKRFDTQGKLQHALEAGSMTHYPDNDATELALPHLTAYSGAAPLHVSATRGTVSKEGSVVVLRDGVSVVRPASPGEPAARFTTQEVTVYPDDEYLTTAAPVTLIHGRSTLTATGFELNNKTAQAVLHKDVRATYRKETP